MKIFLRDEAATRAFAARLAPLLADVFLVTLSGDLGSGKTTLVRGILAALGYEGRVKSPTYSLVEPYAIAGRQVNHFDLYRLADPEELEYIGFADYLGEQALNLIEWPEKAGGWLPPPDLEIHLQITGEGREVSLLPGSKAGELVCKMINNSS